MLFSIGLVTMFTIGGLSGVTHAVAPADTQQTDTYYIVAHFHYVLFGGAFFGFMGGFYFYWPKVFGYLLNERVGKVNFWLMLLGFNLTFGPMHILGLQGMPRRIYTYDDGYGFELLEQGRHHRRLHPRRRRCLLFFCQHLLQLGARPRRCRRLRPADPWDARTHRVDDPVARRPSTTSTRSPPSPASTTSGTASTARTRTAGSCASPPPRTSPRTATARTSTCRRRRTGRSCWPSACRSSPTACIYNLWLCVVGGDLRRRRHLRLGRSSRRTIPRRPRPRRRPRRPTTPSGDADGRRPSDDRRRRGRGGRAR